MRLQPYLLGLAAVLISFEATPAFAADCIPTGASDATCDGVDDDCDGSVDEDYVAQATSCGTGACAASGVTSCVAGVEQDSCTPGTPAANDASCDGVDDDCDGSVDEGYASLPTSCGTGGCASDGSTACLGAALV